MSTYSKAQEDRIEQKLRDIGFELVEDVARRKKKQGDRVMQHTETGLVITIDNKSTRGEEEIRIFRESFNKIKKEAVFDSVPALTFTFKGRQKCYIAFEIGEFGEILDGAVEFKAF